MKRLNILLLLLLLLLLPLTSVYAQTCQTGTIPASTPTTRFVDQGDGTVIDEATGLSWKRCSEGQSYNSSTLDCEGIASTYTWQQALQQVSAVNSGGFAGYSDWRLPNLKEIASIVERQCIDPAINLEVFPATPSSVFWSASPYAANSDFVGEVNFNHGYDDYSDKSRSFNIRLVRGGQ